MHDSKNRSLLYFNSSDRPPLLVSEINQAGWHVKLARDIQDAQNILFKYSPRVAIAQFDDSDHSLEVPTENFFRSTDRVE